MVRKLKHHEQKLLKKVDFLQWKHDDNVREIAILRRYHIQKREDYHRYNKLCGKVKHLLVKLQALPGSDPVRKDISEHLLQKLYEIGLIKHKKNLHVAEKLTASSFCRRRLPVVMVRLKMAQTVQQAVTLIEQGHVRIGPTTVLDPAVLVTRPMEDFVTWVEGSKIRHTIAKYNDQLDDFDLLQC